MWTNKETIQEYLAIFFFYTPFKHGTAPTKTGSRFDWLNCILATGFCYPFNGQRIQLTWFFRDIYLLRSFDSGSTFSYAYTFKVSVPSLSSFSHCLCVSRHRSMSARIFLFLCENKLKQLKIFREKKRRSVLVPFYRVWGPDGPWCVRWNEIRPLFFFVSVLLNCLYTAAKLNICICMLGFHIYIYHDEIYSSSFRSCFDYFAWIMYTKLLCTIYVCKM